jgi:hypothetical protein
MLPLLLPQLVWALSGASFFIPYDFDPIDIPRPSWTQPMEDSLRVDRPAGFRAVVHDAAGTLIGRDTAEMSLHLGGLHWRRTLWSFGADTVRDIDEYWYHAGSTRVDSLVSITCKAGTCRKGARLWTIPTPEGLLTVVGYSETAENVYSRYDSTLRRTDSRGRRTYSRTWRSSPTSVSIDSLAWKDDAPSLWTSDRTSYGTRVQEFHHLTWDDTRLVRDSLVRRTTKENGSVVDTTLVSACTWDGTRIQSCFTLPDSTTTGRVQWSAEGLPVLAMQSSRSISMWTWDASGRLVRTREWGTETDLDSLVYGDGPLPERSLIYSCTGIGPGFPDSCALQKVRTFEYGLPPLATSPRSWGSRGTLHDLSHGRLRIRGLHPEASLVVLMALDGRILSRATPVSGECTLVRPEARGLILYSILDAKGRAIASGRVPGI